MPNDDVDRFNKRNENEEKMVVVGPLTWRPTVERRFISFVVGCHNNQINKRIKARAKHYSICRDGVVSASAFLCLCPSIHQRHKEHRLDKRVLFSSVEVEEEEMVKGHRCRHLLTSLTSILSPPPPPPPPSPFSNLLPTVLENVEKMIPISNTLKRPEL